MDVLFMFMGALCLVERTDLFTGNDFLMFVGSAKGKDYDLRKVFQVKKWIFLVDTAYSLEVGSNQLPNGVEIILLVMFGATLAAHVHVFKGKKFRKEG